MEDVLSERTTEKAYVRFVNCTQRRVQIIWINFTGAYVKYGAIEQGQYLDVNTYKNHTWVAVDDRTLDRLRIEDKFVYSAKTTQEFFQERFRRRVPSEFKFRIRVPITIPVYSLRHNSLLAVRNLLRAPEDADELELPNALKNDLKKVIQHRNNQLGRQYFS